MSFNIDEIKKELEKKGYYIHTNTSNENRLEANKICEKLTLHFNENLTKNTNEEIIVLNREIPPSCNFGVIYRSNITDDFLILTQDKYKSLLEQEITNQIK